MYDRLRLQFVLITLKFAVALYRTFYLPIRVLRIRRKKSIKVAFILSDLGKWKTEPLYRKMLSHERFSPEILVTPYVNSENAGLPVLKAYIELMKYNYQLLEVSQNISDIKHYDIIIYQESYSGIIGNNKKYRNNLRSLFCYVSYAFHTNDSSWFLDQPLENFAWQVYFENTLTKELAAKVMTNKGVNCYVTGIPFSDLFLSPFSDIKDPWKQSEKHIKRIIWAPHHSIRNNDLLDYSNFLRYCDYMISMAEKYEGRIQIAFKPHPLLLTKLYVLWGKEKTDKYYSQWACGKSTQLVLGDYVSLFMHSDALIHDCGSFQVEYHYTRKPVMYLIKDEHHADGLNEFGKMAFDLHYKGRCEEDIEAFINDVIEGRDEMKEARDKFYNDYLLPPYGNSASDNIIKAILGE